MTYTLRPYQEYALDVIKNWIKYRPGVHGYIKAPGGSGKSILIAKTAEYCHDKGKRVLALARSEKLLTQNRAKFSPSYQDKVGIYCAGIGEKDLSKPITLASVQSIFDQGDKFRADVVLIDEVQNLHPDDEGDTQYWRLLRDLGNPQIIGYTATDWRTASGSLNFGDKIAEIPIWELIKYKFLVPPTNKAIGSIDLDNVQILRGEYNGVQLESIYLEPELLAKTIEVLQKYTANRHSVVMFAQSRKHGNALREALRDNGMDAVFVDGDTPKIDLTRTLDDFEQRRFKYLINVALLIEGWDCPSIDCVVVATSTTSKGKFEQILYRGTRPAPHLGKEDFLVLDFGRNFERHGPLGSPYKEKGKREGNRELGRICPECEAFIGGVGVRECVDCGYQFPSPEPRKVSHSDQPDHSSATVYSSTHSDAGGGEDIVEYTVTDVWYREHKSKKGNLTIKVEYRSPMARYGAISEWLSPYSDSEWARRKCVQFFRERGVDLITEWIADYSMDELLHKAEKLRKPQKIIVNHGEEFPRIVSYIWGAPEPKFESLALLNGDEIPWL